MKYPKFKVKCPNKIVVRKIQKNRYSSAIQEVDTVNRVRYAKNAAINNIRTQDDVQL